MYVCLYVCRPRQGKLDESLWLRLYSRICNTGKARQVYYQILQCHALAALAAFLEVGAQVWPWAARVISIRCICTVPYLYTQRS